MPSPVGHTLAGCCLLAAGGRARLSAAGAPFAVGVLLAANLPDLDFAAPLLRPLGVALAHQGPTHSLAFIVLGALALAAVLRGRERLLPAWGWFCAAGATHLLFDFFSHDDSLPLGLPLLWPLSPASLHPTWTLFPGTDRDNVLGARNVRELLVELAVTLPLLWLLRNRHAPPALPRQGEDPS